MLQAICIKKVRNKSKRIIGYELQDDAGNTKVVSPEELKAAMRNGTIFVPNLSLTTDGRIVGGEPNLLRAAQASAARSRFNNFR